MYDSKDSTMSLSTDSFFPHQIPPESVFASDSTLQKQIATICHKLHGAAQEPHDRFNKLDAILSEHLDCIIVTVDESEEVISAARQLLFRLPRFPPLLMAIPPHLSDHLSREVSYAPLGELPATRAQFLWQELDVVYNWDTNLIRTALNFASPWGSYRSRHDKYDTKELQENYEEDDFDTQGLQHYLDFLSELWEYAVRLSSSSVKENTYPWFIVKAFLAAAWQRSSTLLAW